MTKKRFIDKKKSVTYRLVPAERDADDDAPLNILVPIRNAQKKSVIPCPLEATPATPKERIFPGKGPRPDWDPDVVAGLDDDFDFENPDNILEDDFISQANAGVAYPKDEEPHHYRDIDECDEDDMYSDMSSVFSGDDDNVEESGIRSTVQFKKTKSLHSHYSMTSAVTNCSEAQKLQNEKFEQLLEQYDEDQIGALDFEDVDGHLSLDSKRVQDMIDSAQAATKCLTLGKYNEEEKNQILNLAHSEKPEQFVNIVIEKPIEFDCESILSTYSTIYNHPTIIKADQPASRKLLRRKLTKSQLKQFDKEGKGSEEESDSSDAETFDNRSTITACNFRPKDETPEEKKERKRFVKEVRRENRAIKKENKQAFKTEKKKQLAQLENTRRNCGMKIV